MEVRFDRATVELDALQRAAYAVARAMTVSIRESDREWVCDLWPAPTAPDDLPGLLRREVIDQALRMRISRDTEAVRNLIFAVAFADTGLVEQPDGTE